MNQVEARRSNLYRLSDDERAAIERSLADTFASDEGIAAIFPEGARQDGMKSAAAPELHWPWGEWSQPPQFGQPFVDCEDIRR